MKRLFTLILLLGSLYAQPSLKVAFVDDTPDVFGNAERFRSILTDSLGYTSMVTWDVETQGSFPSTTYLDSFDLVIWHTSTWGDTLYLWGKGDTTNTTLIHYLDQGGNVWLVGLDFLFDKFGGAPDNFLPGSFEYDYLGIDTYLSQSYADDGALGVSVLDPVPGPITGLSPLSGWIFSTVWWVDGVDTVNGTLPVYAMGGTGYPLNGQPCATLNTSLPTGSGKLLAFYFDPALLAADSTFSFLAGDVMNYFEGSTTEMETVGPQSHFQVYPNPSTGRVTVVSDISGWFEVKDITGKTCLEFRTEAGYPYQLDTSGMMAGMYLVTAPDGNSEILCISGN